VSPGSAFPMTAKILVLGANGYVITSRTHYRLLGLKSNSWRGWQGRASQAIRGILRRRWPLTQEAVGEEVQLIEYEGAERFDILPLLVATDGAIAAFWP